jgi:hypothetical protein
MSLPDIQNIIQENNYDDVIKLDETYSLVKNRILESTSCIKKSNRRKKLYRQVTKCNHKELKHYAKVKGICLSLGILQELLYVTWEG